MPFLSGFALGFIVGILFTVIGYYKDQRKRKQQKLTGKVKRLYVDDKNNPT